MIEYAIGCVGYIVGYIFYICHSEVVTEGFYET